VAGVRFWLLGPLRVSDGDTDIEIKGTKRRLLLATLLADAGRPVSKQRLIDVLWGEDPPPTAVQSLHNQVLGLRRDLHDPDGALLRTTASGYLVAADAADVDALTFERHVAAGRAAHRDGDWSRAATELRAALALWRDEPLAGLPPAPALAYTVTRWSELRRQALDWRIDCDLRLGRHADIVTELAELVQTYPMREGFAAHLMLAYYRSGRQADALSTYTAVRDVLVTELGVEPGDELRRLHGRILAGDPALMPPAASARTLPVPAQLPASVSDFTGRGKEVARLCDLLSADAGERPPVVATVTGVGGIGKTTLAVHVAHRMAADFPDGQLYVNLRGAGGNPPATGDVLARFLRDLGTDPADIPVDDDERAARYRSRLADRRMLVLLDDASDTGQVTSLLPGSPGCATLVTSRHRLALLSTSARIDLGVLDRDEARDLFGEIAGRARVTAEPDAADRVLDVCAGLPLAIRIAAARLVSRPKWPITLLADRLADVRGQLDELSVDDIAVRTSFRVSYANLGTGTQGERAFRLFGLWPGGALGVPAAAALLDRSERDSEHALESLVDVHLVESPAPAWYGLHELLRVFAAETADTEETPDERAAATSRLLAWYLHTADAAAKLIRPSHARDVTVPQVPNHPGLAFESYQDALDWCERERVNLVAAVTLAAATGRHDIAWQLPCALYGFFHLRGYQADWIATLTTGLASARRIGDRHGESSMLNNLASIHYSARQFGPAKDYFQQALAISQERGDRRVEAIILGNLGSAYAGLGEFAVAVEHDTRSLAIRTERGDTRGQAVMLGNLADHHRRGGDLLAASEAAERGLVTARESGDRATEAILLHNLGEINVEWGRFDVALAHCHGTLAIRQEMSDLRGEVIALDLVGTVLVHLDRPDEAVATWRRALAIAERMDESRATELAARINHYLA